MRHPSVIALISLVVILMGAALSVPVAAEGIEDGLTVIAIDDGIAPNQADMDVAETALGSVATSVEAGGVGYITYGTVPGQFTLLRPGADTMIATQDIVGRLRSTIGPYKSGQFEVLSAAYANMTRLNAPRGSRLVVITTGRIEGESEATPSRLQSIGELFAREGWQIDVMTVPSTVGPVRELMLKLSTASGGRYYDLGATDGMIAMLHDLQGLKLSTVIDAELRAGAASVASIDVAPETESLSVAFLRTGRQTQVQLFRPNGAAVDLNIAGNTVSELPNVVVYTVNRPTPGSWQLQAVGAGSKLVAGVEARNPLQLGLVQEPPFSIGSENVLLATSTIGGSPVALPGAAVTARIQWADGSATVHQLNDSGTGPDAVSGDGIYSVLLPAVEEQGYNDVSLELTWNEYEASLNGNGVFRTEVFPTLNVVQLTDVDARLGDQASIATVRSVVDQYPYLITANEIKATITGPDGATTAAEVRPVALIEDGKAWEFEVFAALPTSGEYTVAIALNSEHLGRDFSAAAPSLTTAATISLAPTLLFGLQIWAWAVILVVAVLAVAVAYVITRQIRPYGYLYDDQGRLVADFSRTSGTFVHKLFARSRVPAREIPGLPFHGGEFAFSEEGVELHYEHRPGDPSIRVNSHPAAGPIIRLTEDVWLGVGGRLLRFVGSKRQSMAPAPGDGN